ncbi:response regulator transcription factor [Collimonas sp. NPDC087041]|uniref:response regulator transcription factor n=1 Tax=Collimonas sp. NPDC087041 TaxID=3363960 RepID=UPI0038283738
MKIAVLDDHLGQTDSVCRTLVSGGHVCHPFQNGSDILIQLHRESYDMLVLAWQSQDISGPRLVHWVRDRLPKNLPILFISSRFDEDKIVESLMMGIDDYMIKPIRRSELIARVQVLLRRAYPAKNSNEQIAFGDYVFETNAHHLTHAGKEIETTQKEFDLALLFFRNLGRPLSRACILEAVWPRNFKISSRSMDTHVAKVRSKLQLRPENGYQITPIYNFGYRLEQLFRGDADA